MKELARGAMWTVVVFLIVVVLLVMWQGSGLFIYEGF